MGMKHTEHCLHTKRASTAVPALGPRSDKLRKAVGMTIPADRGTGSTATPRNRRQVSPETTGAHSSATDDVKTTRDASLSPGENAATMSGEREGDNSNGRGGVLDAGVVADTWDGVLPGQLEKSIATTTRCQAYVSRPETSSSSASNCSKTHVPDEEEAENLFAESSDAYGLPGDDTEASVSEWDSLDDWDVSGESSAPTLDSEASNEAENPRTVSVTAYEMPTGKVGEDDAIDTRSTREWLKPEEAVAVPKQTPLALSKTTSDKSSSKHKRQHRPTRHKTRGYGRARVKGDGATQALNLGEDSVSALDDASLNRSLTVLLTELGLYQSVQRTALEHHLPAKLKDEAEVEKMRRMKMSTCLPPRVDRPHFSPTFVELGGPGKGPTVSNYARA